MYQILEALESDDENDEQEIVPSVDATYDHPEHVVMVTTVSDVNLDSGKFACIGPNKVSDTKLPPQPTNMKTLILYEDVGLALKMQGLNGKIIDKPCI